MSKKAAVLVVGAVLCLASCRWPGQSGPLRLSGALEMTEHSLGAAAAGRVETVTVEEGDRVSRGQVLATLDRYEQAKREYARLRDLFKVGGAGVQEVEHAALVVRDQTVVSPVDGVVLVKAREAGEIVPAGGTLVVVGDPSDYWVRVYVPEGHIGSVAVGQDATVRFDGAKRTVAGRVRHISPQAEFTPRNIQTAEERVTQTFAVKVAVTPGETHLHPGMYADVEIALEPARSGPA